MPTLTKNDSAGIEQFLSWVTEDGQYGPDVAHKTREIIEAMDDNIVFIAEDIAWEAYCLVHEDEFTKAAEMGSVRIGATA